MNIAMFSDAYYPRINGVTISVKSYAESLTELGHNVCIVCCNYEKPTRENHYHKFYYDENVEVDKRIKVLRLPALNVSFSKEDKAARIDQWHTCKREMDSFKPDIIHINSEFVIGYFGLTYARHRKVAMVYTFHTLWEDYATNYINFLPERYSKKLAKEFIRFYLKRSDMIICPTERIQNVVSEYKIEKMAKILPTGIPNTIGEVKKGQKPLFYNQLYKGFPLKKKKRILLYVGRVVKEKNLGFLFPVLEKVKKVYPDTMLVIVGGGPELEPLQKQAENLKLAKNVCFTGYQSRDDLAYFYKLADVFVFPSVTETQGLVTIEAMMTGLPVVAIGEMGTVDVMQGDNGGFMVKHDVEEFSAKVLELLSNKDLHEQKSKEALEWSKKWSLPDLTNQLVDYYKEALEIRKQRNEARI